MPDFNSVGQYVAYWQRQIIPPVISLSSPVINVGGPGIITFPFWYRTEDFDSGGLQIELHDVAPTFDTVVNENLQIRARDDVRFRGLGVPEFPPLPTMDTSGNGLVEVPEVTDVVVIDFDPPSLNHLLYRFSSQRDFPRLTWGDTATGAAGFNYVACRIRGFDSGTLEANHPDDFSILIVEDGVERIVPLAGTDELGMTGQWRYFAKEIDPPPAVGATITVQEEVSADPADQPRVNRIYATQWIDIEGESFALEGLSRNPDRTIDLTLARRISLNESVNQIG